MIGMSGDGRWGDVGDGALPKVLTVPFSLPVRWIINAGE
jgi:hypothetical protein